LNKRLVKLSDKILLSNSFYPEGHSYEEAPLKAKGMESCTIQELISTDFHKKYSSKDDHYFFPGRHIKKMYRYRVADTDFNHPDEYRFCLLPIDIDIHEGKNRTKWMDKFEAKDSLRELFRLLETKNIDDYCRVMVSSRGGIRLIFILEEYVNSLEWRFLYENLVKNICEAVQGNFTDRGKMTFQLSTVKCTLDPRNPGSLTRVPLRS